MFTAADGTTLPAIGFGTGGLRGDGAADAVASALRSGYRLVDSAVRYRNEGAVAEGVRRSGVPREEVVVASKLPGQDHGYADALATVRESVLATGLGYLDLYLIHWPNPRHDRYVEAWRALIEARERGWVRAIGVSNFLPAHLDRLVTETGVVPAVNQVELHPHFPQATQRAHDAGLGVVTQAWAPLARAGELLEDPVLTGIARAHGVSVGEIVLAWHAHLGVLPIPKSTSPERQRSNLAAVDLTLSDDDVAAIAGLARPDGRMNDLDPAVYHDV